MTTPEKAKKSMEIAAKLYGAPAISLEATWKEFVEHRESYRRWLATLDSIQPSCNHCEHNHVEYCRAHQAEIPREFLDVAGECAEWRHDPIPF